MSEQILLRPVTAADAAEISALHALVFGPGRFTRAAYRVREGTAFASPFCRLLTSSGRIIAAIRMTEITIGGHEGGVMLGPLAVAPEFANLGHGRHLMAAATDAVRAAGFRLIVLVGDEPYYGRLGYVRCAPGQITMPGPVDPARMLALDLMPGALGVFRGMVAAAPSAFAPEEASRTSPPD